MPFWNVLLRLCLANRSHHGILGKITVEDVFYNGLLLGGNL